MRVLGIDPGITRCGLGVVDVDPSRRASMVFVGVARSSTELAQHFRLAKIADAIDHVISLYEPEVVAIEQVFAQDNLRSVSTTMQVMGVALAAAGRAGLPMAIHTPSEVKSAVTGNGLLIKRRFSTWLLVFWGWTNPQSPLMPLTH